MEHSATSSDGRLVVLKDNDGRFIAQSWIWRNGNVVCFDSIEANAIENNTDAEQKKYVDLIANTYKVIAEDMIKRSQETVERFKEKQLAEINKGEGNEEKKQMKREDLEKICDESQIKRVTVGQGCWDISKKIAKKFSDREVDRSSGRVEPQENVKYINDSDVQFIIAEAEDLQERDIKTGTKVQVKYRDERKIEMEKGEEIYPDTIFKIKQMEKKAHKEQMQVMSGANSVEDLAKIYECSPKNLRVIHGSDWYYVYANNKDTVQIYDLARGKFRFEDERSVGSLEMGRGLEKIMLEAMREGKEVEANLREDTSYISLLKMKQNGLIEQVGEDEKFEFGSDEYSKRKAVSEEEQSEILSNQKEIKEKESTLESTTMHHMKFKPTEKYKRRLEKRYNQEEVEH